MRTAREAEASPAARATQNRTVCLHAFRHANATLMDRLYVPMKDPSTATRAQRPEDYTWNLHPLREQ